MGLKGKERKFLTDLKNLIKRNFFDRNFMKQKISFRFDWLTFNTYLIAEFFATNARILFRLENICVFVAKIKKTVRIFLTVIIMCK